jgi:sigma-E factor negative regulatory protein RseA
MSIEQSSMSSHAETLSALVDGEAAPEGVARACAAWRSDASARQTWHAYQLIGDVLRSDDLASAPARDEEFLKCLRARLADEPVVLAPQPTQAAQPVPMAAGRSARRWRAGAAVAAGFVAVAGVLLALQAPSPESAPAVARAPSPIVPVAATTVASPAVADANGEHAVLVTDGKVIRDARLDRYLAAHQRFAGASALGVPSSFLRSATTDGAKR